MNVDLIWWARLFLLLAADGLCVITAAWIVARALHSPQSQRTVWQAALLGVALLWVAEIVGVRGYLARLFPVEHARRMLSARVLDPLPAKPVSETVPQEGPGATAPTAILPRLVWWPGGLWLIGSTLLTIRLLVVRAGLAWCVQRSRSSHQMSEKSPETPSSPPDAALEGHSNIEILAETLCLRLGLRGVRLLVWPRLRGPVAFGMIRPTVALPDDFAERFSPAQRAAMLAHELAHLTARDPMWLALTDFVCALGWWHPAIWWARRHLRSSCESAADEAAALIPGGRGALAESLVVFGRELVSPRFARGLGVAGDGLKSQLAQRVKTLLHASGEWRAIRPARLWAMRTGVTCVVATLLLTPWPGGSSGGLPAVFAAARGAEPAVINQRYQDKHPIIQAAPSSRTNSQAQLRALPEIPAAAVLLTNAAPSDTRPIISLEVQFAEITERSLNDLGLDWLFGQSPTNNPVLQRGAATALLTEPGAPHGQNLRVDLLCSKGQSTTLTAAQFAALRRRLKEIGGVDFLAAPQITTLSGRQARLEISEVQTIVNGMESTQVSATNTTGISYTTENISTGPSVDIFPWIEGNASRLAIIANVTEFLGYDQPSPGQDAQNPPPGGKPSKGTIPRPRLRVRSVEADARIQFGDTMALRGPLVDETLKTKGQVPILGAIPLLGRLFQSESKTTIRKRLYIFVTPVKLTATAEKQ